MTLVESGIAPLNRKERRALASKQGNIARPVAKPVTIRELDKVDDLCLQEDLSICQAELMYYQLAQEITHLGRNRYVIFKGVGIPEALIRLYYAGLARHDFTETEEVKLWMRSDPRKIQQMRGFIGAHNQQCRELHKRVGGIRIVDEDSDEIIDAFIDSEDITIEAIFQEILRQREERIGLIKMQIGDLQSKLEDNPNIEIPPEYNLAAVKNEEESYLLANWAVFWTTVSYSVAANHLVAIPTTSRSETLENLKDVTRKAISIKPISVLRALEFHLRRDMIQQALATRATCGPARIKDWVKIKRGKDRLCVHIAEDTARVIFFVKGRDEAYNL